MAAIEHSVQMISGVYGLVDAFICPSEFIRNKFIEYGFYEDRLVLLNHFIDGSNDYIEEHPGDYLIYVGRLTKEKGIMTLIDAAIKIGDCKLKIIGEGPLKDDLIAYTKSRKAENYIEFLGHKSHEDVIKLLQNCKFLVIPSEWYEVTGLVIIEAFACGKPVIGSRIGGIPELVKDHKTGLLFEPGNADDLSSKIGHLSKQPGKIIEMGKAGRSLVREELNAERHYEKLMEIYKKAMVKKG